MCIYRPLNRFRKSKLLRQKRLRARIFHSHSLAVSNMKRPVVVALRGETIFAESDIRTFRAADGLWKACRVEDVTSELLS